MPLQVRPGYVNPLTTLKENRNNPLRKQTGNIQNDKPDKLTDLRIKQQTLQNEMLLMQSSGSDSGGDTSEKLKVLQEKLKEVSDDLRVTRNNSSSTENKTVKPDYDTYEKTEKEAAHPGIYRLERDQENNYLISHLP